MQNLKLIKVLLAFLVLQVPLIGCSRNDPASRVAAMNDARIKQLANLYMAHQMRNGSSGPKNEQAFKEFIKKGMSPHRLEMMQVDPNKVDELFVSENDGKPFEIRYAQSGGVMSNTPVVFEREGKDGSRQVAFTNGHVEQVDDTKYQELLQGGKPVGATSTVAK